MPHITYSGSNWFSYQLNEIDGIQIKKKKQAEQWIRAQQSNEAHNISYQFRITLISDIEIDRISFEVDFPFFVDIYISSLGILFNETLMFKAIVFEKKKMKLQINVTCVSQNANNIYKWKWRKSAKLFLNKSSDRTKIEEEEEF